MGTGRTGEEKDGENVERDETSEDTADPRWGEDEGAYESECKEVSTKVDVVDVDE